MHQKRIFEFSFERLGLLVWYLRCLLSSVQFHTRHARTEAIAAAEVNRNLLRLISLVSNLKVTSVIVMI
jgi:hypothetical protein